ncbi:MULTISPECIES: hypothetical protein [unclassified Snodgrassella]|uniref:hypothetical protein n=1 Tax=unclassified Snodgrassella TaxID=2625236 RepID=UPI0018DC5905|nr:MULTISPECIES: hypothetical protein [unclassified Snodgrassella]MBI0096822.1 hypothetical protein [Snodgrassella sp. W8134]MBI0101444.1 hypothetical protein [Snodgrassella sp. W8135]
MANLKESSFWEEGIYQWETSDPVLGGENGIDNVPTRQLANRTKWLKDNKLDKSATAASADLAKKAQLADKLSKARNVGGVAFDGSADIDLPGVNKPGNQNTSGNAATASYAAQIAARKIGGVIFNAKTDIDLPGVNIKGNQDTSGNANTASRLLNAIKIGGINFDGSTNINLPGVNIAGNQNTSGNAASATVLKNSRQIILNGDVSGSCWFNGDGNAIISTRQVNSLGVNQNWSDVTGARGYSITYTNQTSSPIAVAISFYHINNRSAELIVNGVLLGEVNTSNEDSQRKPIFGIVPPGHSYCLNGNLPVRVWAELRRG